MSNEGEIWFRFTYQDSRDGEHLRDIEQTVSELVEPEVYAAMSKHAPQIACVKSRTFYREAVLRSAEEKTEVHLMAELPALPDPLVNPLTFDASVERKLLFRLLADLVVRPSRQEYVLDFPPSRRLSPQQIFADALCNLPLGLDGLELDHCEQFLRSHTAVWMLFDQIHAAMAPIMGSPRDSYKFTPRIDSIQIKKRILAARFTLPFVRAIQ